MPFVYSTLVSDQRYNFFEAADPLQKGRPPRLKKFITIKGKADLSSIKQNRQASAMTFVSDEDFALLKQNDVFQRHLQNGHILISNKNILVEDAAKSMKRDTAAQKNAQFYEDKNILPAEVAANIDEMPKPMVYGKNKK